MPVGICYHKTIEHCTFATCFGSNVYALLVRLSEFEFHKFVVQIALASCGCSSGCGCGLCLWVCSVDLVNGGEESTSAQPHCRLVV